MRNRLIFVLALTAIQPNPLIASEPPATSLELGVQGLQQVAITTADLRRAVAFYQDKLGLPLLLESNGMAFFDLDGVRLMVAADGQRTRSKPTSILYFNTADFDRTVKRMKALHLPLEGGVETVRSDARGDLRLQQFTDPDGNALAVMGLVRR